TRVRPGVRRRGPPGDRDRNGLRAPRPRGGARVRSAPRRARHRARPGEGRRLLPYRPPFAGSRALLGRALELRARPRGDARTGARPRTRLGAPRLIEGPRHGGGPRAASRRAPRAVGRDPVRVGPALPAEDLSGARVGSRRSGGGRERIGASRAEDRVRAGGLLTRPKPLLQYPTDSRTLRLGTLELGRASCRERDG